MDRAPTPTCFPRLVLGIPVIASSACGLAKHDKLLEVETGSVAELRDAFQTLLDERESYVLEL